MSGFREAMPFETRFGVRLGKEYSEFEYFLELFL